MHRNWTDLIKPKSVEIEKESRTDKYCRFICEPLERGFGQTIGNGLRRILLSSLQGAAITAVKIEGAVHEFMALPEIREDVVVIAADEVRKQMYGGYDQFPPGMNMMVIYEEMVERAKRLCEEKESVSVIFDTTMLYDERRLYFRRQLDGSFDRYLLILLKLKDYSLCLQRNHQRPKEKWVPDHIIMDMASHYEDPSPECKRHFDFVGEVYVD